MKVNNLSISLSNSKLGAYIPTFNLPAGVTCDTSAPCYKHCYARRGNHRFESVQRCYNANLNEWKTNPEGVENTINEFLQNGLTIYKFFRWHSSGDIPSSQYFEMMVRIATANPLTRFLCFTKKYAIIDNYIRHGGLIPSNLNIVLSAWGSFAPANPYKLPVAFVEIPGAKIPVDAFPCLGNCEKCQGCWGLKYGQAVKFKLH